MGLGETLGPTAIRPVRLGKGEAAGVDEPLLIDDSDGGVTNDGAGHSLTHFGFYSYVGDGADGRPLALF